MSADPAGYVDGATLYPAFRDAPNQLGDPLGLVASPIAHKGQNWQPLLNGLQKYGKPVAVAIAVIAVVAAAGGPEDPAGDVAAAKIIDEAADDADDTPAPCPTNKPAAENAGTDLHRPYIRNATRQSVEDADAEDAGWTANRSEYRSANRRNARPRTQTR